MLCYTDPEEDNYPAGGGGGVLPYKGLIGTCGQSGFVFRDFCLKQGVDFYHFVLNRVFFLANFLNRVQFWAKCLKQGIKNQTFFVRV